MAETDLRQELSTLADELWAVAALGRYDATNPDEAEGADMATDLAVRLVALAAHSPSTPPTPPTPSVPVTNARTILPRFRAAGVGRGAEGRSAAETGRGEGLP